MVNNYINAEMADMNFTYKGHEVLTAVVMKRSIFWDIMPSSLLKAN
jgi:hypothetical protein